MQEQNITAEGDSWVNLTLMELLPLSNIKPKCLLELLSGAPYHFWNDPLCPRIQIVLKRVYLPIWRVEAPARIESATNRVSVEYMTNA